MLNNFVNNILRQSLHYNIQSLFLPQIQTMENFQNRIDQVLIDQGRTQIWLAKEIGKCRGMVNYYCRNKKQPPLDTSKKIADILGVTVNDLIKETE